MARDVDLLDQLTDVGRVAPDTKADAGIARHFAGPRKLLFDHAPEMAALGRVVHRADEVEVPAVAPELPVLPDGVSMNRPVPEDRRRDFDAGSDLSCALGDGGHIGGDLAGESCTAGATIFGWATSVPSASNPRAMKS